MNYDICIISFSDIRFDARTSNLFKICKKMNLRCLVITTSFEKIKLEEFNDNIIIPIDPKKRVLYNWYYFLKKIKIILKNINIKTLWAADLYSLVSIKYIKNKSTINIIYDSREIYSALSTLCNHPIKQKVITHIERKFIKNISQLVVSGELDKDYIKKYYNLKIPIYVIYNYPWANKINKSSLIKCRFNISDNKTILIYQGVILKGRGLLPIIKAIRNEDDFVLIVFGEGQYKEELIEYCKKNKIESKVYFCGNIKYDELYEWTSCGDIGLCNIEPLSQSYIYALPNKLFEYFQAELPVLVTDLPALSTIINEYGCGEIISVSNNNEEIIKALNKIRDNYEIYKNNVKVIANKYHYETQYDLIKQIIKL